MLTHLRGKIDIVDPESRTKGKLYCLTFPYATSFHMLLSEDCLLMRGVKYSEGLTLNTQSLSQWKELKIPLLWQIVEGLDEYSCWKWVVWALRVKTKNCLFITKVEFD